MMKEDRRDASRCKGIRWSYIVFSIFSQSMALESPENQIKIAVDPTAHTPTPSTPPLSQEAFLQRVADYFNTITTLYASFEEIRRDGHEEQGYIWLQKPGKLHMRYRNTFRSIKILEGWMVSYEDGEDPVFLSFSGHPLALLLQEKFSWEKTSVAFKSLQQDISHATLMLTPSPESGWSGALSLVFSLDPFFLREWKVYDEKGLLVGVYLSDITVNIPIEPSHFSVPRTQSS